MLKTQNHCRQWFVCCVKHVVIQEYPIFSAFGCNVHNTFWWCSHKIEKRCVCFVYWWPMWSVWPTSVLLLWPFLAVLFAKKFKYLFGIDFFISVNLPEITRLEFVYLQWTCQSQSATWKLTRWRSWADSHLEQSALRTITAYRSSLICILTPMMSHKILVNNSVHLWLMTIATGKKIAGNARVLCRLCCLRQSVW